jgi:hypothetical protein
LFINAFGEELIIENAETAMAQTCAEFGVRLIDYTAAPRFEEVDKGHEWIIELETLPTNEHAFVQYLDDRLQDVNSDYAGKRIGNLLMKLPKVHFAKQGTFKNWLAHKGKLGGQNKVPRLSNHRAILEEVLEFL